MHDDQEKQFQRILEIFKKQEGKIVNHVWPQDGTSNYGPQDGHRPEVTARRCVAIDFADLKTGKHNSIFIGMSYADDSAGHLIAGEYDT